MRIAVVQMMFAWEGGAERSLDQLLSMLSRRHTIALFTLDYTPGQYAKLNDLERHVIPGGKSVRGHFHRYYEKQRLLDLAKAIKAWSPDIIRLNKDFQYSSWLSKTMRVPLILHLGETITLNNYFRKEQWRYNKTTNPISKLYRRFADPRTLFSPDLGDTRLLTCVSQAVAEITSKRFPRTKVKVIYNGIDHSWFTPTWEDEDFALCVSRFDPQKNLDLLMKALGGANYPVVIYGSVGTGYYEEDSRSYLEHLKQIQPENFRIQIHHDNSVMKSLMQRCSVFLHAGRDEGFPNVINEAMSCGKPVVGHNSGGTPECIGSAGYLAGDDPADWRGKVDGLMASPELRKELAKKAYERSLRLTWERAADETETAMKEILRSSQN